MLGQLLSSQGGSLSPGEKALPGCSSIAWGREPGSRVLREMWPASLGSSEGATDQPSCGIKFHRGDPPLLAKGAKAIGGAEMVQCRQPCLRDPTAWVCGRTPSHYPQAMTASSTAILAGNRGAWEEGSPVEWPQSPQLTVCLPRASLSSRDQDGFGIQPMPLKHPVHGAQQVLILPSRCAHICLPATCHSAQLQSSPWCACTLGLGTLPTRHLGPHPSRVPWTCPSPARPSAQIIVSIHVPLWDSFTNCPGRPGGLTL